MNLKMIFERFAPSPSSPAYRQAGGIRHPFLFLFLMIAIKPMMIFWPSLFVKGSGLLMIRWEKAW